MVLQTIQPIDVSKPDVKSDNSTRPLVQFTVHETVNTNQSMNTVQSVESVNDMFAIQADKRHKDMVVFVEDEDGWFILDGITNLDWENISNELTVSWNKNDTHPILRRRIPPC